MHILQICMCIDFNRIIQASKLMLIHAVRSWHLFVQLSHINQVNHISYSVICVQVISSMPSSRFDNHQLSSFHLHLVPLDHSCTSWHTNHSNHRVSSSPFLPFSSRNSTPSSQSGQSKHAFNSWHSPLLKNAHIPKPWFPSTLSPQNPFTLSSFHPSMLICMQS